MANNPEALPLPLAEVHRARGALFEEPSPATGGRQVPGRYGEGEAWPAEHEALTSGCGWIDRSWMGRLELSGEDRLRFLNGQVTCDVKSLEAGRGKRGFFTTLKGKVRAETLVLALEDRLWLEVSPGTAEALTEHLQKYILADRVEVRIPEEVVLLTLAGPKAGEVAAALGAAPDETCETLPVTVAGTEGRMVRQEGLGPEAFTLWIPASAAAAAVEAVEAAGAVPAGLRAFDAARLEAGVPWYGWDFDEDCFPQETGLEDLVSYTKGCYLGQEVVARLHYRGQVSRQLRGLAFDGEAPPAGTELLFEQRSAGRVTSAVASPALGRAIGLGMVQRRAFEPGTRLELAEDLGTAVVTALPFVS